MHAYECGLFTEIGRKVSYAAREESRIRLLLLTFLPRKLIYCYLLNRLSLFIFQIYRYIRFLIANIKEIYSIRPIHTLYYHPWFEKLLEKRFWYCQKYKGGKWIFKWSVSFLNTSKAVFCIHNLLSISISTTLFSIILLKHWIELCLADMIENSSRIQKSLREIGAYSMDPWFFYNSPPLPSRPTHFYICYM